MPAHVRDGAFGKWLENARGLVDHPQPVLGCADPGVEVGRPALPADRRLRLTRRARARLRRPAHRPAPTVHRRADAAQSRRPDRSLRRCGGSRTSSTAGSSPVRCRTPRCTTRSRTGNGSRPTSPPTSSSSTSGQTRGWFYTLHVLATALFDKPPFRTCIAHGIILGDDGKKASKSLGNYPDPDEVFDSLGADALRWSLMSSPVLRGGDLIVSRASVEGRVPHGAATAVEHVVVLHALRQHRGPPGHARRRLGPRAGPLHPGQDQRRRGAGDRGDGRLRHLRRVLRSSPRTSTRSPTGTSGAADPGSGRATPTAFDTLALVIEVVCRVAAPLLPLVTEDIWVGLTGWRQRPPRRLACGRRAAGGPGAGRNHGPGARGVLGGILDPQGTGPAGAPPAGVAHDRRARRRRRSSRSSR